MCQISLPPPYVLLQVLLNGRKSNLSYGVSAYVTQDEEFVGVLTVRETLQYVVSYSALTCSSGCITTGRRHKHCSKAYVFF